MEKPLVRWTLGNTHPCGVEILLEAIKIFPIIYPEFDMVICYNNCNDHVIEKLKTTSIPLYKQSLDQCPYPIDATAWKFVPPRLRKISHELFLDNDILLKNRVPAIDRWLTTDTGIITEGLGLFYGKFKKFVKSSKFLCAGGFGLPPNFDFGNAILQLSKELADQPLTHPLDEQGLTATVITSIPNYIVIPIEEIKICMEGDETSQQPAGFHFAGANRGKITAWKKYKSWQTKLL